jgi:hypothetical protein
MSELEQRARELLATQGCVDGFQRGQIADAVMVNPRRILRAIEAALRTQSTAGVRELVEALAGLLDEVDQNTCRHESTHRGGVIWTICDDCGAKWADDEGGFVPHKDSEPVARARQALRLHEAAEDGWLPIEQHTGAFPVLVSRPTDREVYKPTTAFVDATGVWRVFRSEGGNTPLPFVPTHYQELPAPPVSASERRKG